MTGSRPRLQSPSVWPVDFGELLRFTLSDALAQEFVHSSCNRFFEPNDEQPARVCIRRGAGGSWAVLPREWQQYFEAIADPEEREQVLVQLSTGGQDLVSPLLFRYHVGRQKGSRGAVHWQENTPESLADYLTSCRALSLDRTCSDSPIVSFPPSDVQNVPEPCTPAQKQPRTRPRPDVEGKINIKNALQAGKSPKKDHEVERFSSLGGYKQMIESSRKLC